MKKLFSGLLIITCTAFSFAQVGTTREGHVKVNKKPSVPTITDNDTIIVSTGSDRILKAISFGRFKTSLPTGGVSQLASSIVYDNTTSGFPTTNAQTTFDHIATQLSTYLPLTGGTLGSTINLNPSSGVNLLKPNGTDYVARLYGLASGPGLLELYPSGTTSATVSLTGDNTGNGFINHQLSIGKSTAPTATLDVNGQVRATQFLGDGSQLTGIVTTDNQNISDFSLSGNNLSISIERGNTSSVDLSSLSIPDDQQLSLSGTNLSITDGNTVDLAPINTDDQTLSFSTAANLLTIQDGNTVNLNSLNEVVPLTQAQWDALSDAEKDDTNIVYVITDGVPETNFNNYVTSVGVTGTTTKTITLERLGLPDLTTTFQDLGGGTGSDGNDFLTAVTQSNGVMSFNVPNQVNPTFDLGTYLSDEGYLTAEVDGSTTNEIQTLNFTGRLLTISGGNSVTIPSASKAEIDALAVNAGQVDGLEGSQLVRNDQSNDIDGSLRLTTSGTPAVPNGTTTLRNLVFRDAANNRDIGTLSSFISGDGTSITRNGFSISTPIPGSNSSRSLIVASDTFTYGGNNVWHAGNDGPGSTLDADSLDGISSSQFLRADQSGTVSGTVTANSFVRAGGTSSQFLLADGSLGTLSNFQQNLALPDPGVGDIELSISGGNSVTLNALRNDASDTMAGNLTANGFIKAGDTGNILLGNGQTMPASSVVSQTGGSQQGISVSRTGIFTAASNANFYWYRTGNVVNYHIVIPSVTTSSTLNTSSNLTISGLPFSISTTPPSGIGNPPPASYGIAGSTNLAGGISSVTYTGNTVTLNFVRTVSGASTGIINLSISGTIFVQ